MVFAQTVAHAPPLPAAQDVIGVQRGVDADEGDRPRVAVRGRRNSGEGWDCTCDGATLVGARVGSLGAGMGRTSCSLVV